MNLYPILAAAIIAGLLSSCAPSRNSQGSAVFSAPAKIEVGPLGSATLADARRDCKPDARGFAKSCRFSPDLIPFIAVAPSQNAFVSSLRAKLNVKYSASCDGVGLSPAKLMIGDDLFLLENGSKEKVGSIHIDPTIMGYKLLMGGDAFSLFSSTCKVEIHHAFALPNITAIGIYARMMMRMHSAMAAVTKELGPDANSETFAKAIDAGILVIDDAMLEIEGRLALLDEAENPASSASLRTRKSNYEIARADLVNSQALVSQRCDATDTSSSNCTTSMALARAELDSARGLLIEDLSTLKSFLEAEIPVLEAVDAAAASELAKLIAPLGQ